MLLFSRNSSSANNGVGSSRDVTKLSANKNGRNSYYEQQPSAKSSSVALNVASVAKKVVLEGEESPTFLKRSSNRSTMKKSRPHSWHSTLQRGFQRARSRSSGRGERNRAAAANATATTPVNGQKQNGTRRMDGLRAVDVMGVIQEQICILSGGRDRRGGAILTFPATTRRERAKPEDYRCLLQYLIGVPCDDVRDLGFSVVIDMRGSTWTLVKPILKVLQEHFSTSIHAAHIIKPDNFWQKQRTSLGSQKYKFETNMISMDALHKVIDASQLTQDLEGTLHYDHSIWIELRCALEDFLWQSSDMLDRLDDMREDLNHNDFADEVVGAKKAMDVHAEVRRKILKIPVENIDSVGQRLLQRLSSCESGNSYDSGYSGRDSSSSNMTCNPDMQSCIPQIMQLLDQVHSGQQQLLQLWQIKKAKLEQCLKLRIFEQDCEKMFDWIYHNRDAFLSNYVEIGHSFQTAKKLQDDHNHFTLSSNTVYANINRILTDASSLIESQHYASPHLRSVASRLDKAWKDFATGLDERTTVLALSVLFHQKAEQYGENVPKWSLGCDLSPNSTSSDITNLESSIHSHQSLYENMCQAYTEVHSTSKKLLYQLDHLVQTCCANQNIPPDDRKHSSGCPYRKKSVKDHSNDYSEGASHVLSVIHDILAHHRSLEAKWHAKKIKLHQRLALRLFQEDVKQVLDWLQNHGEVFLRKNVGIGRNLQKARAYQKSHETFEGVVQNTYTNAEKLLAAAAELAQTGECNAEDIYAVAHELESHISSFAQRVEQRRRLLELSVLFYAHTEELTNWLYELKSELASEEVSDCLEGAERLIEQFSTQRDSTLDACASTIAEGKTLLEELKSNGVTVEMDTSGSVSAVQTTLEKLSTQRDELGDLWATRKLRLDLCLQLRLFERDALELSSQYELWAEQLQNGELPRGKLKDAEIQLRNLSDHVNHIQASTYEVAQRGQDLLQHFETSGINLMSDSQYNGQTRVQVLLEYLQEREMDLEDLGSVRRIKLEQCIQLCQFETDANQVIRWIHSAEGMLSAGFSIPGSLQDAEQLKKEHEQFQTAIEKTHASAVHVRQRAETLLTNNHYDPKSVRDIADGVTHRWQQLVTRAEERHKLVTASLNFYKTAEQVCSVLDSLEREYKREDDWLSRHPSSANLGSGLDDPNNDRVVLILQLINKHQEQKEAFLKACTLARRTAETFLKYSNRSLQHFCHGPQQLQLQSSFRGPEAKVKVILEKLLTQENRVLEYWTSKKKRLDQNQQFCLFERSARQSLAWIKEEGDIYLSTHTNVGNNRNETLALLEEHNSFKEKAKETREKVKLLLQLADTLVDKGHAHAPSIKKWVEDVDATYKDFSTRMDQYRGRLETTLGIHDGSNRIGELSLDRESESGISLGSYSSGDCVTLPPSSPATSGGRPTNSFSSETSSDHDLKHIKEFNEEKRRSARRKEFILAELLETERTYVKDLETAVNCFLKPMLQINAPGVPAQLRGKEDIIFGNVEEILLFHKSIFLKELEKYETMPEDVGHVFVTWAQRFDSYVEYCTNKPHSTQLLVAHGGAYFEGLQRRFGLEHPISAYLIKPVQRITKYQLLLKDLLSCCDQDVGEIKEGLEVCLNVPKKANDALHLSLLDGCDLSNSALGEVVLQDSFQIWDPKQLIRKAKDRHIFLFELYLVFCKELKDSNAKSKYIYKSRLMTAELGVTEHIEGDECKFAVWTGSGRSPMTENKVILKASSIDVKHNWVKKMRQLIQDTFYNTAALPTISISSHGGSNSKGSSKTRFSRDFEDGTSLDGSIEQMERGSLASFGSGNTTDSDNKGCETTWVISDYLNPGQGELSVSRGQQVEILDYPSAVANSALVRLMHATSTTPTSGEATPTTNEGLVPISCLKQPPGGLKSTNAKELDLDSGEGSTNSNTQPGSSGGTGSSSPVSKKKGFSGKWLPNIRKLSQGKLDKTSGGGQDGRANNLFQKQTSKNRFKLSQSSAGTGEAMGNKLGVHGPGGPHDVTNDDRARSAAAGSLAASAAGTANGEDTEDPVVEVPPPMQPISSLPVAAAASSTSVDQKGDGWTTPGGDLNSSSGSTGPVSIEGRSETPELPVALDPIEVEKAIEQRSYRLQELLESERVYINDLDQCCQYIKYMKETKDAEDPEIHMPEALKEGKDRMIFGNIEAIYEWHRDFFLKNLTKSMENPVELGNLFKRYDRKFQMYVVYCQNKPKSEFIVSEFIDNYFEEIRLKLGFKLRLTDLLIKPIQRLTKYHMLLEAILKYSQRAGLADEAAALACAFHVMTVVPNQANEMMDIGRLQGFEGKITAQGKLLHKGSLCALDTFSGTPQNGPPKMRPFTCFLFEQIMIFSETVGKKTQFTSPVYVYKAHFLVNKMALDEKSDDGDPLKFLIKSNDPARDETRIVCQAEDIESKNQWMNIMKKQLQTQMDFLRALQAPIAYHNKLAKEAASYSDMTHLWEVVDVATTGLKAPTNNRPRSNPNDYPLDGSDLSSKTMSLPSSPVVKEQPGKLDSKSKFIPTSIDRKLSASLLERSGSSGGSKSVVAKMHFLDGFRHTLRPRTKSDDFGEEGAFFKLDEVPVSITSGKSAKPANKTTLESSLSSGGAANGPSEKAGLIRRWSETNSSAKNTEQPELDPLSGVISVGSSVKVLVDYRPVRDEDIAVSRGDLVQVLEVNSGRGYRVKKLGTAQLVEGWLPGYVLNLLTAGPRRPAWTFRKFRKPSFNNRKDSSGKLVPVHSPTNQSTPSSPTATSNDEITCRVRSGDAATLTCSLPYSISEAVITGEAHVLWKGPQGNIVLPGSKYSVRLITSHDTGDRCGAEKLKASTLALVDCRETDAGRYTCAVVVAASNENLHCVTAYLYVLPVPSAPSTPRVQDLKGTTALLVWEDKDFESSTSNRLYTLETRRLRTSEWMLVREKISELHCSVDRLHPGECYSFRVYVQVGEDGERSDASAPSAPLSVPLGDLPKTSGMALSQQGSKGRQLPTQNSSSNLDACWQRDFERRYIELEELGRGRFSVVRRCQEILSGDEVAVKFINRRKQVREETQKEFEILSILNHENIVSSTGLFLTATSDAIVMKLITGSPIFEHFCEDTTYSEKSVCTYMDQVLKALAYLHAKNIIHLDLKPENLLLDTTEGVVRLIDFGSAQEIRPRFLENLTDTKTDPSPEFYPPEVISNGPVGTYTDMWCFGVLLYVSLSGLSPFLDDSDDETTSNILRCDFSFPNEYFSNVSNEAKDLIRSLLSIEPGQRSSATSCLESSWIKTNDSDEHRCQRLISSVHLCTLVRRRMKKLNSVVPVQMTKARMTRPESLYRK